jgi:hypothetical protein
MPVAPEAIWDVLADPGSYGYWVLGSKEIRDADAAWPQAGSRFHHTVGFGPVTISDHTESLYADAPRRLRMRARALPFGLASVTLELEPDHAGTMVTIVEHPTGVYAPLALVVPLQLSAKLRNAESLMRLEELALRR